MARTRPAQTLVSWLAAVAAARPNHVAVFADGEQWTYRRLWERSREVANVLGALPAFERETRIALIGANGPEYLAAYLGVQRAGGVVVPLNPMLSVADLHLQIELVGCAGVLIGDVASELADALAEVRPTWSLRRLPPASSMSLPSLGPQAPACVLLTSGSTGQPKGVVHTQGTMLHAAMQLAAAFPTASDERSVAFLPFFASIPEQVLPTLLVGGAVDVIARFDVDRVCAACRDATSFDAVPTLMARLLDNGDVDALRHLRWVSFASEPMPTALLERWWQELPSTETHQFYGMTEMLTITHAPDRVLRRSPHVVGVPFPTSSVSVIDERGNELPPGAAGEVICRSPARMARYQDDPTSTAGALTKDGAMRTGDVGVIDEQGRLQLTGRLKDLIISGGLNVAPAEIEAVACRHPLVSEAAVVGVPDPYWGETPIVVAVPASGELLTAADVLAFCRSRLAGFKRPSAAAIVDALPLTGIGKSAKAEIQRRILEGEVKVVRAD